MTDNFVNLHTHTDASGFDGFGTADKFAARAAELGQTALAATEHGTLRGVYQLHKACEKAGVRPIFGCEFYLADDATLRGLSAEDKRRIRDAHTDPSEQAAALKKAEAARRDRDHLTAWAMNDVGLRNLFRLSSWSWDQGFYYKPRIDMKRLAEHGEGLLVSTGCPGGVLSSPLRAGDYPEALRRLEALREAFPGRLYIEIMPHPVAPNLVPMLVRLAEKDSLPLIATQDAHYPAQDDSEAQDVLLAIQTRAKMSDPDRFCFPTRDFWLRSRAEMEEAFRRDQPLVDPDVVARALDETVAFAERCDAKLPLAQPGAHLAAPELPAGCADYTAWLLKLCREGIDQRFGGKLEHEYPRRLMHELKVIKDHGFSAYFCMVHDLVQWAKGEGIAVGPGRGSAAGSLVSYLLGITELDPIAWGLLFERFIAPGRSDLPDIDLDIDRDRRDEVLRYLSERYGADHVAHISTSNTIKGRRAIRDLGRVYEIPEREVAPVAALVPELPDPDDPDAQSIGGVLANSDTGREFAQRYPDVADVATRLEGQQRDVGIHAAGVIVSRLPLRDVVPLETRARKGGARVPVVALDMHGAEAFGLVKLDVLGLKNMTTLRLAAADAKVGDFNALPKLDVPTLRAFTEGRFGGVFQYDTPSARRLCRGFAFKSFSDIATMTALNRPGPIQTGLAAEYIERSANPGKVPAVHPIYDEVFADTYGVPVFQEQLIRLARELAGFDPVKADGFRKAIAKKKGMADYQADFVAGAAARGMSEHEADNLFHKLEGFGSYAFNRCVDIDTWVATVGGAAKRAGQLREGDCITLATDDGTRISRVRRVWPQEIKDRVRLVFEDGSEVRCSLEHRWLTERGVRTTQEVIDGGLAVAEAWRDGEAEKGRGVDLTVWPGLPHEVGQIGAPARVPSVQADSQSDALRDDGPCESHPCGGVRPESKRNGQADLGSGGRAAGQGGASTCVEGGPASGGDGASSEDPASGQPEARDGFALRGHCRGATGRASVSTQSAGEVRQGNEAGGLRGAVPDRGGWTASLPAHLRRRTLCRHTGQGCDPERLGYAERKDVAADLAGRVHFAGGDSFAVEGDNPGRSLRPTVGYYACRRPVSWERIGPGQVVDIEVDSPHLFVLDNGLISHNSHSYSYAWIAHACMYLKVHHPGAFFSAVLATETDEQVQMRMASEARKLGILVQPPDVNVSGEHFTLHRRPMSDGAEQLEIVGSVADLKGVGEATAKAIAGAAPFTSLRDLYERTAGAGMRGVTVRTFEALARSTALRSLLPHHRVAVEGARPLWRALQRGEDITVDGPALERVADYSADEAVSVAAEVYPLHVDSRGWGELETLTAKLRDACKRQVYVVSDDEVARPGIRLVAGRASKMRAFPGRDGKDKTTKVLLVDSEGGEAGVKFDQDVVEVYGKALDTGALLVAVIETTDRGSLIGHAVWTMQGLLDEGSGELAFICDPEPTKPTNPWRAMIAREEDEAFTVEGIILRVRRHTDRNGGKMLTVALAGSQGFLRFFAFSSRARRADCGGLLPGRYVSARLRRLSGFAATLSDLQLRF